MKAKYNDHVNAAKLLKLHRFPIQEIFNEVGRMPADFATSSFRAQCTLFTMENYDILLTIENEWSVTNKGTQILYKVSLRNDKRKASYLCGCYVNCSFGIPCRHILALIRWRSESMYSTDEVLPYWIRTNGGARDTSHVLQGSLKQRCRANQTRIYWTKTPKFF